MDSELVVRDGAAGPAADVVRYCGYGERTDAPVRRREPLGTAVVLILGLGPDLRVHDPRRGRVASVRSFVGGLTDTCVETAHDGEMRGLQVDLSPLAARRLLGVAMHELAREVVPLADVLGRTADELDERLAGAATWDERFALAETFLARRLAATNAPPADVEYAWRRLTATAGTLRVEALARELGCSRRHLAARFREHVGLPPKLVARMLRFRRAAELLAAGRPIPEVAAACGYYDQPHLDRDFREFARTTPTAYAAAPRVPFLQDEPRAAA